MCVGGEWWVPQLWGGFNPHQRLKLHYYVIIDKFDAIVVEKMIDRFFEIHKWNHTAVFFYPPDGIVVTQNNYPIHG